MAHHLRSHGCLGTTSHHPCPQRVPQATNARRGPPSPVSGRPFKPWHSRMQVPAAFASEKSAPQGSGSKEEPPATELVAVVKRELSDGTTLFCFGTKEEADAVKEAEAEEAKALEAEALKDAEAEEARALQAEALEAAEAEEAKALEAEALKEAEADEEVNAANAEEVQPDPLEGSSNNGALAAEAIVEAEEVKEEKVKEEEECKDEAANTEASSRDLSQELVGHLNDLVDAIDNHMLAEAAAAAKDTNGGSVNHASAAAASKAADDEESTTAAVTTEEVVQEQPGNADEEVIEEEVEDVVEEEEEEEVPLWDRCPREAVLGAVYGTDRGLDATADTRARLEEALGKLEATNEQPRPSQTMPLLAGRWKLVYTNTPQALAVLGALRALPVVTIGDITQHVDGNSLEVQNKVEVAVPFMLSFSAHAGFEVRSPRMLKLKYHKAKMDSGVSIATPQLFAGLEVPEELSILGQTLDLRPLRAALDPVLQTVQSVSSAVTAPEMEAPQPLPSSYRVITYLDSGLQVSRDHNGGVFVMVKDEGFFDIPRVGFR